MGINIGRLMQEAGIKGAKSTLTLEEALILARQKEPNEVYSKQAMERLPGAFTQLKNPNEVKDEKDFLRLLRKILDQAKDNRIDGEVLTVHTIIGICQLAHWHRDRMDLGPSRKKRFEKIIPWLLERREKVVKKPPADIGSYMLKKLDERYGLSLFF